MAVRSEKVTIDKLVKGMYVSGLDRPWIETDYTMEGFYIETEKDIEQLSRLCEHVYVDVALTGLRIDVNDLNFEESPSLFEKIKTIATTDIKELGAKNKQGDKLVKDHNKYQNTASFEMEYHTANSLYRDITVTAANLFSAIKQDESINLTPIKSTATAIVDSVVRNPDAFLWLSRLHSKDTHSHNRSIRTAVWTIAFARYLGLERNELNNLSIAMLLSNLGKVKLPDELLEREDNLEGEDLLSYQRHVSMTLDILKIMGRTPQPVISIINAHCERYDGSGYPNHLMQQQIPLLAQIAGLVSYYEEITNRRIVVNSLDPTRAVEHLYKLRDQKFMAELVEEFICSIGIYPVGSIVELNSKEIAVIIEQNPNYQLLPKVMVLRDPQGNSVSVFKIMDLYEIDKKVTHGPKIINTYALGSYGIDAVEITESLKFALSKDAKPVQPGGFRRLLSKLTS